MTDPATAAWIAIACALVFTVAVIVLSCAVTARDLPEPDHDLELWAQGTDWIEPA